MPSPADPASTAAPAAHGDEVAPIAHKVGADLPFNVDERRRLFDLLTDQYEVQMWDFKSFLTRTHGSSAGFIEQTVRLAAALAAADDDREPLRLTDAHVSAALDEMFRPPRSRSSGRGRAGRVQGAA